jgi:hypothetical protein
LALPPWPDLTGNDARDAAGWICEVWPTPGVGDAVTIAGPDLARVLTGICDHPSAFRPRQVHRAAEALMRYLLRWTSRATPFGLFAGIAPTTMASTASEEAATPVVFGDLLAKLAAESPQAPVTVIEGTLTELVRPLP